MKVKASLNNIQISNSNFKYEISAGISIDDIVRFEGIFKIPENVRIDFSKLKEVVMDIPIINELEKYSSKELEDELNSRNENYVVCKYCNSRLRKLSVFFVGKSFTCPMCGQINYNESKGEF